MRQPWTKVWLTILLATIVVECMEAPTDIVNFNAELSDAISKAKVEVKEEAKQDRVKRIQGIDQKSRGTSDDQLNLFAAADAESLKLAKAANIQLKTLQELAKGDHIDPFRLKVSRRYLRLWKKKFKVFCPRTYEGPICSSDDHYRTADGSCNNIERPTWGARLCPQLREIPPMYDDGVNEPRQRDKFGLPLPSARLISNIVHRNTGKSPRNKNLTVMVMQWGQFIDHEFVATPVLKGEKGASIQCCGEENKNRSQCFPIEIPDDDPFFKKSCMNFVRSAPVPNHNCNPGFREQINQVTSFIDGSAVYGSSLDDMNALRKFVGGLLKTTDEEGKLLPKSTPDKCVLDNPTDYCQKAGDARVNVVPSLGFSHTTFVREHNRLARELAQINPHWSDETIFQETRRIVWALLQHIHYGEYIPTIFNKAAIQKYRLGLIKAFNKCYRKNVNPSVSNVFAVAAFRFGHSQIPNYQATMTKGYQFSEKKNIETVYHNPHMIIYEKGKNLDGIARWLVEDPTPLADRKLSSHNDSNGFRELLWCNAYSGIQNAITALFEDGTRDKLFMDKQGNSLDLPALNIQRGRDHGIPAYNHWRIHCKLAKAEMGDDGSFILPDHTEEETQKLEQAYRHVDDIDLFSGAMTETLEPNSSLGPTFECLLGRQFKRLKFGDRFWYENPDPAHRFTPAQLRELKKSSLARVLCDNYKFNTIQPDVFRVEGPGNERVNCTEIPQMNLSKWTACKASKRFSENRPDFYKRYCKRV